MALCDELDVEMCAGLEQRQGTSTIGQPVFDGCMKSVANLFYISPKEWKNSTKYLKSDGQTEQMMVSSHAKRILSRKKESPCVV